MHPPIFRAATFLLLALSILHGAPVGVFSGGPTLNQITGPRTDGSEYSLTFGLSSISSGVPGETAVGSASFGYLNLVSGGSWLIQNQPIPLLAGVLEDLNNVWFTSTMLPPLGGFAIINDVPYGAPPAPDADWTGLGALGTMDWGSNDPMGQAEAPHAPAPGPAVAAGVIEGYLRGGVPDIKQLRNECGPTATTNSLLWLIKKYNLPTDKLPKNSDGTINEQELLKQLADAMKPSWNENTPVMNGDRGYPGLNGNDLYNGKVNYFRDKMLPIVVHGGNTDPNASGAKAFDFTRSELKKGQDVEFLIDWPGDGSHWVTVVGYIDEGKDKKTLIVHDPDAGRGKHYWKLKDDGTFTTPKGTALWAVAESPIPEPSTVWLIAAGATVLCILRRRNW